MRDVAVTGLVTYAIQFPNGELVLDPDNWILSTTDLGKAHLWLRPLHESDEARERWLRSVRERMHYPSSGAVSAVRARP